MVLLRYEWTFKCVRDVVETLLRCDQDVPGMSTMPGKRLLSKIIVSCMFLNIILQYLSFIVHRA